MEAIETEEVLWIITTEDFRVIQVLEYSFLCFEQRYTYTANVCRDLRGVYREIGVRGFQIYGDYM